MEVFQGKHRLFWEYKRPGNLEMADHTTAVICHLKEPCNVTELNFLLGSCHVHWRSVPDFPRMPAPLNMKPNKCESSTADTFSLEASEIFETLLENSVSVPILDLPRSKRHSTTQTNAWNEQIGFVLMQAQLDRLKKPLRYCLRPLILQTKTEMKQIQRRGSIMGCFNVMFIFRRTQDYRKYGPLPVKVYP